MSRFDSFDDDFSLRSPSDALPRPAAEAVNPYAAPAYVAHEDTAFGVAAGRPEVPVVTPVSFPEVVRQTWLVYRRNKWASFISIVGAFLMMLVFIMMLIIVMSMFMASTGTPADPLYFVVYGIGMYIGALAANLWCLGGLFRMLTGIARGESRRRWHLFTVGDVFLTLVVYWLLLLLMVAPLVALLALLPDLLGTRMVSGPDTVQIISGCGIGVLLFLTYLFAGPGMWMILDRRMGPLRALGFGARMIGANVVTLILLLLWCGLLLAVGIMAYSVGFFILIGFDFMLLLGSLALSFGFLFFILPLLWLTFIVFFMQASGEKFGLQNDVF